MTKWIKVTRYVISVFLFMAILCGTGKLYPGQEGQKEHALLGKIAFSSYISRNWEIWIVDPDGTNPIQLTHTAHEEQYPAWSSDGSKIAYATNEGEIWIAETGKELQKIPNLPRNCTHPAWSPDGTEIVFTSYTFKEGKEDSDLWIADLKQRKVRKLMEQEGIQRNPAWSPDGSTIVYTSAYRGNRGRPIEDLWVVDANGINPRCLVANNSSNIQPDWSPDGRRIAFATDQTGNMEIWMVGKDGKNARQLTYDKAYDADPNWSPDGSKICFVSTRGGKMDIWVMDSDGGNLKQLTGLSDLQADSKEPDWW